MFLVVVEQVTSSGSPGDAAKDDGKSGKTSLAATQQKGSVAMTTTQQKQTDLKRKVDIKTPEKGGVSPAKKLTPTPTGKSRICQGHLKKLIFGGGDKMKI